MIAQTASPNLSKVQAERRFAQIEWFKSHKPAGPHRSPKTRLARV